MDFTLTERQQAVAAQLGGLETATFGEPMRS